MYNSKDLVVDEDLTFLSYNQTINAEFTVEEILDSPLWSVNSDNGLIKAIPLFNCDKITSSNESDKVLDDNKCVILENNVDTIVKCISDDTGSMHYYAIELYAYAPYTKLDVIDEVTVYCILHDEYLNTVGNVNVDVYIDDEISGNVTSDSNGVCRFKVDQPCTVRFVYGELESNIVVIDEPQIYTLSIETDKQSLFTDESVTVTGVLTVDGEVYADQSIALYDGSSLIDTVVTDSNGAYEKTLTGLSVGVHTFKAVNSNAESSTISITVNEPTHTYSLSIASDKQSILTTESVTITGTLLMDSTGYSGQSIQLYDGSTLIDTLTTDINGGYSKTISGLTAGTHSFKAVNTNAESSTITVTVTEPTPVHDYSLSVASTKDKLSYADSESATLTATLLDNNVAVAGETLSYVIKHGATTIDSGTGTTDSNGEISFNYTATGVGDVDVIVSYSSLLQETYEVQDCYRYDDASSDKTSQYAPIISYRGSTTGTWNYNSNNGYYGTINPNSAESMITIPDITGLDDFTIEFDVMFTTHINSLSGICAYEDNNTYSRLTGAMTKSSLRQSINGSVSEFDVNHTNSFSLNTWVHYKYTITNGNILLEITKGSTNVCSRTISYTPTNSTKYGFALVWHNDWVKNSYIKNIKVKAL